MKYYIECNEFIVINLSEDFKLRMGEHCWGNPRADKPMYFSLKVARNLIKICQASFKYEMKIKNV